MANLPVPNPRTAVAGEFETAAFMNAFRDAINFVANPPLALLFQSTAQTINNTTNTAITFDSTVSDTYGGHSNTTNNSRYVAQVAGWYRIIGTITWAANNTGDRTISIAKNGSVIGYFGQGVPAAGLGVNPQVNVNGLVQLNAGDYVEIDTYQDSGAGVATKANGSSMAVVWDHA